MSKKPEFSVKVENFGIYGDEWRVDILRNGRPWLLRESSYTTRYGAVRAARTIIKQMGVDWPVEVE